MVKTAIGDFLINFIGKWAATRIDNFLIETQKDMPYLASFAIALCGLAMMVPGMNTKKWFEYMVLVFFLGTVITISGC